MYLLHANSWSALSHRHGWISDRNRQTQHQTVRFVVVKMIIIYLFVIISLFHLCLFNLLHLVRAKGIHRKNWEMLKEKKKITFKIIRYSFSSFFTWNILYLHMIFHTKELQNNLSVAQTPFANLGLDVFASMLLLKDRVCSCGCLLSQAWWERSTVLLAWQYSSSTVILQQP